MKIGLVASVKPSHPYLENDPAPLFDLHYLRISPWLWFSTTTTSCIIRHSWDSGGFGTGGGLLDVVAFAVEGPENGTNTSQIPRPTRTCRPSH